MKKKSSLLNRKRKSISDCKTNNQNQEENKPEDSLLEQTYSFLNNFKKKISEINQIRSSQIEGILTNNGDNFINKKPKKAFNQTKEDSEESDCCIIYEETFDTKKFNYYNEKFKIESFDASKDCVICFKRIVKSFEFSCGHRVCNKCGVKWIRIKKECPVCRKKI